MYFIGRDGIKNYLEKGVLHPQNTISVVSIKGAIPDNLFGIVLNQSLILQSRTLLGPLFRPTVAVFIPLPSAGVARRCRAHGGEFQSTIKSTM
jgi:hypothetical protein